MPRPLDPGFLRIYPAGCGSRSRAVSEADQLSLLNRLPGIWKLHVIGVFTPGPDSPL